MSLLLGDALLIPYLSPVPSPVEPVLPEPVPPSVPVPTEPVPTLPPTFAPQSIAPLPLAGPYPLNHARILWRNILVGSAASPTDASIATTPSTWERYVVSDATTVTYTMGSDFDFDCVAIAAHTFGSTQTELEIYYSADAAGETFIKIYDATPPNDSPLMVLLASVVQARRVRLVIADPVATVELGVIYAGACLQMRRPIYGGHRPITLSSVTEYANSVSDSGQWLGRSIIKKGFRTQGAWKYTEAEWVRTYLYPFMESAKSTPFFFAWNRLLFPTEVGYCWTAEDISPVNMGKRDLMEFTITMEGYGV